VRGLLGGKDLTGRLSSLLNSQESAVHRGRSRFGT
jgi:hypothetical protein